ncbi:PRC-barrel domain-containing protein [Jiella marina]|uniref:PRC-barrel domain-containing protein n=1 Tax=Jiella sp. LLJ827 TaxID=2917712 RepID=UPI0021016FF4|nr:PRC-barrel domain-containing protein [Jiella sp. LLJ827]MCQ0987732.1 PRC-barrel domain-containing protein [Jiella sp. LLJ827]
MKFAASFAAMALVLAAPAFAQDTPSDPAAQSQTSSDVLVPIEDDDAPVPQLNLMAGQVEDMDVIGPDGEEIGDIENILGNQDGNAQAITVDVGGFLGIGEKTVIIMIDDVSLDMGRLRTTMSKDEIESLPAFDD